MKLAIALYTKLEIEQLESHKANFTFILGFKEISRFFEYTKDECLSYAWELKERGFKVFLQWDILMTEDTFGSLFHSLKGTAFLGKDSPFAGLRVQDPGLLYGLKEVKYKGDIHLICEHGNHNLVGLESWIDVWPEAIKRLVISPQLPAETLARYGTKIFNEKGVELEVLGLGPILLFYTPRKLVSPLYEDSNREETIKVAGTSEESPHKGFPIIENSHGTFMLNTKDQFIFDDLSSKEKDLNAHPGFIWRIDPICGLGQLNLNQFIEVLNGVDETTSQDLKTTYGRQVTKGFFRVNKTDILFKKLKNHRLQDRDNTFVGEVVGVKKKDHVAVLIKSESGLSQGDSLRLLSPEGREKFVVIDKMTNALSESLQKADKGQIIFIPPIGGISVRSMVYISP